MSPISDADWGDARLLWDFNLMGHQVRPCSAAVVLGGCDIGVVRAAAELYGAGMVPYVVFSGSTTAATRELFPRGEAVHFREEALAQGVPDEAILLEPRATNTGENLAFSRAVLAEAGVAVTSALLVCMPYMQRRAYAACRKQWPEVEPVCASQAVSFDTYAKAQANAPEFIAMMVGDTQRVMEYPKRGFAIEQETPGAVRDAFDRLRSRGFDKWLLDG